MAAIQEDALILKGSLTVGNGTAAKPTIHFGGSPLTGFYRYTTNQIGLSINGIHEWLLQGTYITASAESGAYLANNGASATVPVVGPRRNDINTGMGSSELDSVSLIAGGIEGLRLTEVSNKVIVSAASSANVGLTADVGSAQGNGVILASYNVYDICANAGDAATLPAVFQVGTLIYVKNGAAANSMDVFPASGDDAGAGANTAVAVAAGNFAVFMGTTANATWEKIMGGTA